ncbi:MAG TPA: iron ABC transporter permease, partial [Sediminispirochaeta sp.]|nr:iron ABC transporter permease [Sediminispirochaeta sp.]
MKNAWKVVLLPLILMTLFVLDVVKGSVEIPLSYILQLPFADPGPETEAWRDILLIFRLPRAVTALLVGAGLALGGLNMQTLFRNPLAGPSVLGINAGAN